MPENSTIAANRSRLCRALALLLTERPSVTGSGDEASFGPWLASQLRGRAEFGPDPEIWTFPVVEGDPRHVVAMLARKGGRRTVVLTGHYDTVTVADYGDLAPLATRPEELLDALAARLAKARPDTAEARARDDFATGRYLPGRGLLDMKAGLAAGLFGVGFGIAFGERRGLSFAGSPKSVILGCQSPDFGFQVSEPLFEGLAIRA